MDNCTPFRESRFWIGRNEKLVLQSLQSSFVVVQTSNASLTYFLCICICIYICILFVFVSTFVFVFHLWNLPLWGNVYKQSASLAYFHIYRNPFSQTFFQSSIQNSDFPIFRRTLFSFCYGTIYKYHPCESVLSCLRYMRRRRNLTALQVGKE